MAHIFKIVAIHPQALALTVMHFQQNLSFPWEKLVVVILEPLGLARQELSSPKTESLSLLSPIKVKCWPLLGWVGGSLLTFQSLTNPKWCHDIWECKIAFLVHLLQGFESSGYTKQEYSKDKDKPLTGGACRTATEVNHEAQHKWLHFLSLVFSVNGYKYHQFLPLLCCVMSQWDTTFQDSVMVEKCWPQGCQWDLCHWLQCSWVINLDQQSLSSLCLWKKPLVISKKKREYLGCLSS